MLLLLLLLIVIVSIAAVVAFATATATGDSTPVSMGAVESRRGSSHLLLLPVRLSVSVL